MNQQAFAARSLTESIVAFAEFSRGHGLSIGIQETRDALVSAECGLLANRDQFRSALKAIFCHSPHEGRLFERLFHLYWDTNPIDLQETKNKTSVLGKVEKKANASLVMLGRAKAEKREEEGKDITGASETERLKKTDFSNLGMSESDNIGGNRPQTFQTNGPAVKKKDERQSPWRADKSATNHSEKYRVWWRTY